MEFYESELPEVIKEAQDNLSGILQEFTDRLHPVFEDDNCPSPEALALRLVRSKVDARWRSLYRPLADAVFSTFDEAYQEGRKATDVDPDILEDLLGDYAKDG